MDNILLAKLVGQKVAENNGMKLMRKIEGGHFGMPANLFEIKKP